MYRYTTPPPPQAIAYQKSQEIDDVQAGIKEIAECQKTLATMVDQQGSNISQAQADVEDARDKAAEGVNQLQGANKHAKAARKRMCCAFILLLIIGMGIFFKMIVDTKKHPFTVGVIVIVVVVKK